MSNNRSDVANARKRLSDVHRAYIKLQLASGMLVHAGDVWAKRDELSRDETVNMLACVRTRAVSEMAVARALGDSPGRTDLLVDSHIAQLFGAEMVRSVHEACARVDGLWGPTTDWPEPSPRVVTHLPRLTLMQRFALLFRGRL